MVCLREGVCYDKGKKMMMPKNLFLHEKKTFGEGLPNACCCEYRIGIFCLLKVWGKNYLGGVLKERGRL